MTAANLQSRLLRPGDDGYDAGRAAWNLNVQQRPAAVVMAESAADVAAAVRYARAEGHGVAVLSTGHGTAAPADGGVLINTSRMRAVHMDPRTRSARVAAGARWRDVTPRAAAHGLAGLPGSSSGVGVVGYTLGGGFGWLGRRYGLASSWVTAAQVVTADGELVRADAAQNADLFWGLRGGGGNFGVVTDLEFTLHPVARVYGGNLFYPVERARDVLEAFAHWSQRLPDEMSTAVAFRRFPPLPGVPAPLRGGLFVALRAVWCGAEPAEGERLVDALRRDLGAPVLDSFRVLPITGLDEISRDPEDPLGALQHPGLLQDLTPAAVETLVDVGSASPLIMLELRLLGGALVGSPDLLHPMARTSARFTLNAIGLTMTPESEHAIRSFLAVLAVRMRPHVTGGTFANFLDLEAATPQRVQAAYTPEDWRRLVQLKGRWDPDNVFRFARAVPAPARAATESA